jgi:3-phenylpropionate/trans-cinnamate dioxygenase ferredoxin subunit
MTWTRLCRVEDLPPGAARTFEVGDVSLAAARSGEKVFVLENRCSHDDGTLGSGHLSGADSGEIECPRHGGRFDLATGRATRMPAVTPIRTIAAKVEDGAVWADVPEDLA